MPKRVIKPVDVQKVFDAKCMRVLHETCGLPDPIDLGELLKGVRASGGVFVRESQAANNNVVHREIKLLHGAADKGQSEGVALLLQNLSPRTVELLKRRASRLGI